nr:MAG TPA: hypothetical protein [Caudoviricetes sp.]
MRILRQTEKKRQQLLRMGKRLNDLQRVIWSHLTAVCCRETIR